MAKRKGAKGQTTIYKTPHRELKMILFYEFYINILL